MTVGVNGGIVLVTIPTSPFATTVKIRCVYELVNIVVIALSSKNIEVSTAHDNHQVRVLTRSRSNAQLIFPVRDFPGIVIAGEPEWQECIQGSNAVVNLAGMPISTRWSPEIKKEIKNSRIRVTSKVVDLINDSQVDVRPTVLVSATAVGYYEKWVVLLPSLASAILPSTSYVMAEGRSFALACFCINLQTPWMVVLGMKEEFVLNPGKTTVSLRITNPQSRTIATGSIRKQAISE
ncbi:hypothetical protein Vadar_008070 [Vaccinium darrowii]|uniref:Uncharacterized protein n=1 Tax=Vaccinium darrowii TaxID=229202 RepID=A0ACB7WYW9_9ERIC|nr:hypothetical protein Vadar_008070 [Vaccinium darrowii]